MCRIKSGLFIVAILVISAVPLQGAHANGYATYASPLAWSQDGNYLAAALAAQWPQEEDLVQGELRLFDEFGRSELVTSGVVGSPSFRADGRLLAAVVDGDVWVFSLEDAGKPGWLKTAAVGAMTNSGDVLDCRFGPSVEPLSDFLHYTAGERFYGCKVYVLNWSEHKSELVLDAGAEGSAFSPGMALGITDIFFLQQPGPQGGAYERLMVHHPSSETAQLTREQQRSDDYHESNFLFIPGQVIFQRGGWGDWNLYRIELATGKELLELTDAESPAVSADGRYLAFVRRDYLTKVKTEYDWEIPPAVWLRDRQSGSEWRVSTEGIAADFPAIAPDGSRLAWIEREADSPKVMIRSVPNLTETRTIE